MITAQRQFWILLHNALRLDFRPRAAAVNSARRAAPFVLQLFFYGSVGVALGTSMLETGVQVEVGAATTYIICSAIVLLNVLVEYSEILLSPLDGDILYWRPLSSRTIFLARVAHVLVYVGWLALPMMAFPAVAAALHSPRPFWTAAAFLVGGWCSALLVTSGVILLQSLLLRRLPAERFHRLRSVVQLLLIVGFVAAYQLLSPALRGLDAQGLAASWCRWIPAAWFAGLPALAAPRGVQAMPLAPLFLGFAVLAATWVASLRSLAPHYVADVELARGAGFDAPAGTGRGARWDARVAGLWGPVGLGRAGFDFLLAQFAGDRRLRAQLLSQMGIPLGLAAAALVGTRGFDPYAPAGGAITHLPQALAEWAETKGLSLLFIAAYMLAFMASGAARTLGQTPSWRASWVFHAAPLRRYDRFYAGIVTALAYRVVFPALAVLAVLLLVAWRNPLHVAAHLAMPAGVAIFMFPVVHLLTSDPPFAVEPARGTGGVEVAISLVSMIPLGVAGFFHYAWRAQPWLLVACGAAFALLACVPWWMLARKLRNVFQDRAFQG